MPSGFEHRRVLPPRALAHAVQHFWWVRWDLGAPQDVATLPHPCVHITFEQDAQGRRAQLFAVDTARFTRALAGQGWVLGIKLRPAAQGAVRALPALKRAARLDLAALWGADGEALTTAVFGATGEDGCLSALERWLPPRILPELPPQACLVRDAIERVEHDRQLMRVEQLASACALSTRTLERLFRMHAGLSPKWVLRRYRLLDAAERLKAPAPPKLVELAQELGYSDQAHFSRDFRAAIGTSPRQFAERHAAAR
jgi:AraC-like DNA-binding protein